VVEESPDSGTEEDAEFMELGQIEGMVRRSVELQGDGIGNVIVLAFYAQQPTIEHYPHNVLVVPYQDLSNPDAEVAFTLYNFFPEPEPYYLLAVFDEDDSLMDSFSWTPTEGDLMSTSFDDEFEPIYIESGDVLVQDLDLIEVVGDSTGL
jgi:hypothetical protein